MLYDFLIHNYKEGEPIFFAEIEIEGISRPAINKQLHKLCEQGTVQKYETGIYYLPKKTLLKSTVGPSADWVARCRFITRGKEIYGYYAGNAFANQLGISTQVPQKIEIVSNKSNSSPRDIEIGNRTFFVRKSSIEVNRENVYILQLLDLLKNLEDYMDDSYDEARDKIKDYIVLHNISEEDIDRYIREFPSGVYRNYYELRLYDVFTHRKQRAV